MTASEQARADAIADAETLRLYAWQDDRRNGESKCSINVGVASIEGRRARHWLYMAIDWTGRGSRFVDLFDDRRQRAVHAAEDAARAAFRAVPGLRGTDADEKALHGALCLRSKWLNAPCGCGVGI